MNENNFMKVEDVAKELGISISHSYKIMQQLNMVITVAKKHITQEKKESTLQKALDAAHKLIAELKNTVADLTRKLAAATKELSEYKSVRNKLNAANVEQENERLRNRLRTYEDVISRNNLWSYFSRHRGKTPTKDDAR